MQEREMENEMSSIANARSCDYPLHTLLKYERYNINKTPNLYFIHIKLWVENSIPWTEQMRKMICPQPDKDWIVMAETGERTATIKTQDPRPIQIFSYSLNCFVLIINQILNR